MTQFPICVPEILTVKVLIQQLTGNTHPHTHTNEMTMVPKRHIVTKGAFCRLAGWPDGYTEGPITEVTIWTQWDVLQSGGVGAPPVA